MNTPPYTIVKHYRGKYEVFDAKGLNLSRGYVSEHQAQIIVMEYKLQDKCLNNSKLLIAAESVAGSRFKGHMVKWLWEVLIRFDIEEMRLINNKPHKFKEVHDAWIDRISNRKQNNIMPERKNLAKIDVITDCDSGMYHIGETDGGFSESELRDHILKHGHASLCERLTILQWQVWDCVRQINSEKDNENKSVAKN